MKKFLEKINTLDNIKQWEERDSVIKESVSQHSFKVSAIALYLLKSCRNLPAHFQYQVLSYSILHDFDESILGRDISHTVKYNKYNGEEIRDALSKFVESEIDGLGMSFLFNLGKLEKEIKLFVKLADWIAISTFISRNEKMGVYGFELEKEYCNENIVIKIKEVEKMILSIFGKRVNLNKYIEEIKI